MINLYRSWFKWHNTVIVVRRLKAFIISTPQKKIKCFRKWGSEVTGHFDFASTIVPLSKDLNLVKVLSWSPHSVTCPKELHLKPQMRENCVLSKCFFHYKNCPGSIRSNVNAKKAWSHERCGLQKVIIANWMLDLFVFICLYYFSQLQPLQSF